MTALREQGVIPVADPKNYGAVHAAIEAAFSAAGVKDFLKSMQFWPSQVKIDFSVLLNVGLSITLNIYSITLYTKSRLSLADSKT